MSGMMTIAVALGDMYRERAEARLQEWQTNNELALRRLQLTPVEGWPGKNAEQREIEAERALRTDMSYETLTITLNTIKTKQSEIEGKIEALEAQRRALEWDIRMGLVQALNGKQADPGGDPFETAMQSLADETMFQQTDDSPVDYGEFHAKPPAATYSMMQTTPEDEVPF